MIVESHESAHRMLVRSATVTAQHANGAFPTFLKLWPTRVSPSLVTLDSLLGVIENSSSSQVCNWLWYRFDSKNDDTASSSTELFHIRTLELFGSDQIRSEQIKSDLMRRVSLSGCQEICLMQTASSLSGRSVVPSKETPQLTCRLLMATSRWSGHDEPTERLESWPIT